MDQASTKLKILLDTYTEHEFKLIKPYRLNTDQLLVCLGSKNMLNQAPMTKVIGLLHSLHRTKGINFYKRKEVLDAVDVVVDKGIRNDSVSPSYAASLAYSLMKMKLREDEIWFALADYMVRHKEKFELRELGTMLHSLQKVSDK